MDTYGIGTKTDGCRATPVKEVPLHTYFLRSRKDIKGGDGRTLSSYVPRASHDVHIKPGAKTSMRWLHILLIEVEKHSAQA